MADTPNYADWISAVATLGSMVAAVVATAAALKSANSARESLRQLEEAERRRAIREVASSAAAVLVESENVKTALRNLGLEVNALATFNNTFGGSRQRLWQERIESQSKEADAISEPAKPFAAGADSLNDSPIDDIDRVALRLSAALIKVRGLRAEIADELTATRARNAAALEHQRNRQP